MHQGDRDAFLQGSKAIAKYINKPALAGAPTLTGIDDAQAFRDSFQKLGFGPVDQVALMGAHTFGKLAVCAGGLNGIESGPFCSDPNKVHPKLTEANFFPNCKPKLGVVSHCWKQTTSKTNGLTPVFAAAGKHTKKVGQMKNGFGDGGFWDRTPTEFDNDYFKLFANETYEGKDVCCGKTKKGVCHRGGRGAQLEKITKRSKNGLAAASVKVGYPCEHRWCRSDRKGRTHMKGTKDWHEAPHDFVKKGYHHGVTKRMIRLAGDWALLGNPETSSAVKKFAESQDAFFAAFTVAWGKVIDKGYEGLMTCDDADTSVPSIKLKKFNPLDKTEETGKGPFQSDGKGTGCRDTHRKCHKFSPTSRTCKKAIWYKRCPFTCKKCPDDADAPPAATKAPPAATKAPAPPPPAAEAPAPSGGKCSLKKLPKQTFTKVSTASGAHLGQAKKMWGKKGFTCTSSARKAWCHLGVGPLKPHAKAITYQWNCDGAETPPAAEAPPAATKAPPAGCKDTHRACKKLRRGVRIFSPTSRACKRAAWQKRCPVACAKCPA